MRGWTGEHHPHRPLPRRRHPPLVLHYYPPQGGTDYHPGLAVLPAAGLPRQQGRFSELGEAQPHRATPAVRLRGHGLLRQVQHRPQLLQGGVSPRPLWLFCRKQCAPGPASSKPPPLGVDGRGCLGRSETKLLPNAGAEGVQDDFSQVSNRSRTDLNSLS